MKSACACDYRWISMADLNINTAVIWMYNDTSYDFFYPFYKHRLYRSHQVTPKQYNGKLNIWVRELAIYPLGSIDAKVI